MVEPYSTEQKTKSLCKTISWWCFVLTAIFIFSIITWDICISLLGGFSGNIAMDGPDNNNNLSDSKCSLDNWCRSLGDPSLADHLRALDYTDPQEFKYMRDEHIYDLCTELKLTFGKRDRFFVAIKESQSQKITLNPSAKKRKTPQKSCVSDSGDETDDGRWKTFVDAGSRNSEYGVEQGKFGIQGKKKGMENFRKLIESGDLDFKKIKNHGRKKNQGTQTILSGLTVRDRLEIVSKINDLWDFEKNPNPPYQTIFTEIFCLQPNFFVNKSSNKKSFKRSIKRIIDNEKINRILYILGKGWAKKIPGGAPKPRIPEPIRTKLLSAISAIASIKGELNLSEVREFVLGFLTKRGFTPKINITKTVSHDVILKIDPNFGSLFSITCCDEQDSSCEKEIILTDWVLRKLLDDANLSIKRGHQTSASLESTLAQLLPSVLFLWSFRSIYGVPGGEGFILNGDEKMWYRGGQPRGMYRPNEFCTGYSDIMDLVSSKIQEHNISSRERVEQEADNKDNDFFFYNPEVKTAPESKKIELRKNLEFCQSKQKSTKESFKNAVKSTMATSFFNPVLSTSQSGGSKRTKKSRETYSTFPICDDSGFLVAKLLCFPGGKKQKLTKNDSRLLRKLNLIDGLVNKDLFSLSVEFSSWQSEKSDRVIIQTYKKLYHQKVILPKRNDVGYILSTNDSLDKHFYDHNVAAAIAAGVVPIGSAVGHTAVCGILDGVYMGAISQISAQVEKMYHVRYGSGKIHSIPFRANFLMEIQKALNSTPKFVAGLKKRFTELLYSVNTPGKISEEERKSFLGHLDFKILSSRENLSVRGWRDIPKGVFELIEKYQSWDLVPTSELLNIKLKKGRSSFKRRLPRKDEMLALHLALVHSPSVGFSRCSRLNDFCDLLVDIFPLICSNLENKFKISQLSLQGRKKITMNLYTHLLSLINTVSKQYRLILADKFSLSLPFLQSKKEASDSVSKILQEKLHEILYASRARGVFSQTMLREHKKKIFTLEDAFLTAERDSKLTEVEKLNSQIDSVFSQSQHSSKSVECDSVLEDFEPIDILDPDDMLSQKPQRNSSERTSLWNVVKDLKFSPINDNRIAQEIIVAKDGNCLFRSFAHALYGSQEQFHLKLRQETVEYMRTHQKEFEGFFTEEWEEQYGSGLCRRLIEISRNASWGGEPEIISISNLYGIGTQVWEFARNGVRRRLKPYYFYKPQASLQVLLFYTGAYGSKTHYNLFENVLSPYPLLNSSLNSDTTEETKSKKPTVVSRKNSVDTLHQLDTSVQEADSSKKSQRNLSSDKFNRPRRKRYRSRSISELLFSKSPRADGECLRVCPKDAIKETALS